jgi:FkbM family methyltransferase
MLRSEKVTGPKQSNDPTRSIPGDGYGVVVSQISLAKAYRGAYVAAFTEQREMPSPVEKGLTQGIRSLLQRHRTRLERKLEKALLRAGVLDLLEATMREVRELRSELKKKDSQPGRQPHALVPVRTAHGFVAVPNTDVPLLSYLISDPDPERGTCQVLQTLIRPEDHVIDVGANVGIHTLAMGRNLGSEGAILAVEPSPILVDALRQTVRTNGLRAKVRLEAVAAADREGTATLFTSGTSGWSSLTPLPGEAGPGIEVPLRTLDALVEPGRAIAAVKIDVEGSELAVLGGMRRILSESPDIALVVEFGPAHIARNHGTAEGWLGAFREAGLEAIYEIDEATGACTPARPPEQLSTVLSVNLLMTRSGSAALTRLGLA